MSESSINKQYCNNLFSYERRKAIEVVIGTVGIGGNNPIRVQSMTTTNTLDTEATAQQAMRIFDKGGELVRITTQGRREARNLENIRDYLHRQGYDKPLVADIHFNPNAAEIAASLIEKVRINPGNFVDGAKMFRDIDTSEQAWQRDIELIREKLIPFLEICAKHNTAIRIGTNHGSLSDRIMSRYGDTPQGMVESCMEYLRICQSVNFHNIVLSIKASNTRIMVHTVRLLVATMLSENMHYPIHLGVTEAGNGEDGRIKSAVGIGALLADGIGETIRVSLTEDPELEIPVANKLVEHFNKFNNHAPIEAVEPIGFTPFSYNPLPTQQVGNMGGNSLPVVVQSISSIHSALLQMSEKPDYFFTDNPKIISLLQSRKFSVITPLVIYKALSNKQLVVPIVNIQQLSSLDVNQQVFLEITLSELSETNLQLISKFKSLVIIANSNHVNAVAELRSFIWKLQGQKIRQPILINRSYNSSNAELLQVGLGADLGSLFLDGMANGVFINAPEVDEKVLLSAQFGLLQASRVRFSKTEYISCPGCGRTLFELQEINEIIKQRTSHLKGLKIGVMGCIVNGIGEMADADYGYVGSGPGKVSLFKQKEMVKRNVPTQQALDELVALIKENGDWVEP